MLRLSQQRVARGRVGRRAGPFHDRVERGIAEAAAVQAAGAVAVIGLQHLGQAGPSVAGAVPNPIRKALNSRLPARVKNTLAGITSTGVSMPIRLQNWATACTVLASST